MRDNMTVEDAINVVHILGRDLAMTAPEAAPGGVFVAPTGVGFGQKRGKESGCGNLNPGIRTRDWR